MSTENLANLIGQKRRVLTQLRDVGVRQQALVDSGDVATLLKLLSAKQRLVAALQEVERRLAPHHDEDPEQRAWPTPQHRAACASEAAECSRLLAEIMEMERRQETVMTERRDKIAKQLRHAHTAHEARTAYQQHAAASAYDTARSARD